jgi:AraC family transcriptional regulator
LYVRNFPEIFFAMTLDGERVGHEAMPFGRFYGQAEFRRHESGLEWSVLQADPHRVVARHSHEEAHFVLVLDGLYVSTARGAPPVSDGVQLIYNPPGTTHRDRFEARERVVGGRFLTLSVTTESLAALNDSAPGGRLPSKARILDDADAKVAALRLSASCGRTGSDASFSQHAMALALLPHLVTPNEDLLGAPPTWVQTVREYLDDSLGGQASIAEAARAADVHPVHLARRFRQHVGMSPAAYVRQRRIEQAQCLLQHTKRSVLDIALACGFGDQSHFTHAFRRACGTTPVAYRTACEQSAIRQRRH